MAEEVVDRALRLLPEETPRRRRSPARPSTCRCVGRGPADLEARLQAGGIDELVARGISRRLGSFAPVALEEAEAEELKPLADGSDLSLAEARFHLRYGATVHLGDLLLRRVRAGMWQPALAAELPAELRGLLRRRARLGRGADRDGRRSLRAASSRPSAWQASTKAIGEERR